MFTKTIAWNSTCAPTPEARPVEHDGSGGDAGVTLHHAAGQRRVRADEDVVAEPGGVLRHTADDGVLHDHAMGADLDGPALRGDDRAEQHPAVRADRHIAAQHRSRSDVGRVRDLWALEPVAHEHGVAADDARRGEVVLSGHATLHHR